MTALTTKTRSYGYWTDLQSVKFSDEINTTWIQAFPMGTYEHPVHGTIVMDKSRAERMANNVTLNVRDQELDIDYDHKAQDGKAAGWVKAAQARDDGLWLLIEWTASAKKALQDKEYRYFSPEFADEWQHPKTGAVFKDVLFGGAITNRPFLKDILPINLSEVVSNHGGNVDEVMKALITSLGLDPETAKPEDIVAKVTELNTQNQNPPTGTSTPPAPTGENGSQSENKSEPQPAALSEDQLAKLLSDHPQFKAMSEELATLRTANRLSEVNLQIKSLSEGKSWAVPPTAVKALSDVVVGLPKAQGDAVIKVFSDILTTGLVQLGERGGTGGGGGGIPAAKQFTDKVDALTADGKVSYVDAVEQVGREHPQLWEAYRTETLAGAEGK